MNQILVNRKSNRKIKYIFKVQILISVIISIILIFIFIINYNDEENLEKISGEITKAVKLSVLYKETEPDIYFGRIIINKIDLEYTVFKEFNEELLKIAPCKFYGKSLEERGNIGIVGHNYNDNRFFGRLSELKEKDNIDIIDSKNRKYTYIIYDIFEADENDLSVLKSKRNYELTLVTCNNINKKRLIVKSYRREY